MKPTRADPTVDGGSRTNEIETLNQWLGRSETAVVVIDDAHARRVAATLGQEPVSVGEPLPALWHWCFGNDTVRTDDLDPDGHGPRGGLLPPVALPRRMWAGGRVTFDAPIRVGDRLTRSSAIASIRSKEGSSGPLIFVTVRHAYARGDDIVVSDEVDLVYREAPDPHAPTPDPMPAPDGSRWRRDVKPSETLLFRYSAVTFNTHRIHYDYPYATTVEGYGGLVVHGPLTATLLAGLAASAVDDHLTAFSYRGHAPLISPEPFSLHAAANADSAESAGGLRLWAARSDGALAMSAEATFGSASLTR